MSEPIKVSYPTEPHIDTEEGIVTFIDDVLPLPSDDLGAADSESSKGS